MAHQEIYSCDEPTCTKTTTKTKMSRTWLVVTWLSVHISPDRLSNDNREWHYCSRECLKSGNP